MTRPPLLTRLKTALSRQDFNLVFMKVAMLSIGSGICIFASDGYTTLFHSKAFTIFGWKTSSVGVFMILLEMGVLAYITHMFSQWYRKSLMQKIYLAIVVICFSLLCYSGMSSYLWKAYSAEYAQVRSSGVQVQALQNDIGHRQTQIADLDTRLNGQQSRVTEIETKVSELNAQIAQNSKDKSERRTRYANCSTTVDCAGAIEDLTRAGATLERNLSSMLSEKERAQTKFARLESEKDALLYEVRDIQREMNTLTRTTGGMDAERADKVASINLIVIAAYEQLGKPAPSDPFKVAVNFIAIIIYPCYILLNMCLGFNSRGNRLARRVQTQNKGTIKSLMLWGRPVQKIIIPVPSDATAAELSRYVDEAKQDVNASDSLDATTSEKDSPSASVSLIERTHEERATPPSTPVTDERQEARFA